MATIAATVAAVITAASVAALITSGTAAEPRRRHAAAHTDAATAANIGATTTAKTGAATYRGTAAAASNTSGALYGVGPTARRTLGAACARRPHWQNQRH